MADSKTPALPAFTREELVIINNALNEICNGLPFGEDEFQTRIGFPRAKALKVLSKLAKALETKTEKGKGLN